MNLNRRWVVALLAMIVVLSGCSSSSVGSGTEGTSNEQSGQDGKKIEIATMAVTPYLEEAVKQYKKFVQIYKLISKSI